MLDFFADAWDFIVATWDFMWWFPGAAIGFVLDALEFIANMAWLVMFALLYKFVMFIGGDDGSF